MNSSGIISSQAIVMRKHKAIPPAQSKLEDLNAEFDALLARMQTAKARAGMKAALNASPKRLGKAAVAAARKRG